MAITYTSGTTLSFREVMFAFEAMITGAQLVSTSSTTYVIEENGQFNYFNGTNLTYQTINGNTFISGGTIDSIQLFDSDLNLLGELTNLNLDAASATSALIAEATGTDVFALENLLFTQDWTFTAVDGFDHFIAQYQTSQDGQAFGFTGDDTAFMGDGDDLAHLGAGNDTLYGGDGADKLIGGKGRDKLYGGDDNDELFGYTGRDKLWGGNGNDALFGGYGRDVLRGNKGHDVLDGGNGADVLRGGNGKDTLSGSNGNDQLFGGNGKDTFVFVSDDDTDTLMDFDTIKDSLTINGFTVFVDGVIDSETLTDGTEVTVTTYLADPLTGLTGGYEITYGVGDVIFMEADVFSL